MATIREWRNEEWETGSKARDQHELQFMAKKILAGAERKLALMKAEAEIAE